jgi:hypothetical protein
MADNENNRSLFHAGNAFPSFDVSAGTAMPPGILGAKPLAKTPTRPTGITPGPGISAAARTKLSELTPETA